MTGKAKEGEKGVPPCSPEAFQNAERGLAEPMKAFPPTADFEVLDAAPDEKPKRAPEVHTPKRKLSESLAPIREAESRRPSPEEEEDVQKAPGSGRATGPLAGLDSTRLARMEPAEGEVLKVGLFGPRRKSLSEWRYSQEPAVTVATAHYVTESATSRVVVTSAFRLGHRVRVQHDLFLRQCPSTLNFSVPLAIWLYVESRQP